MNKRGWWLGTIAVAVLLGGFARPAHAGKQFVYVMGASCQATGLLLAVSPLTYTDWGVAYQGLTSADIVCPITWAKPSVPAGQIVGELDIQADWNLNPVTNQVPNTGAVCSLVYLTAAGDTRLSALPIPYPVPAAMTNMKYAALYCTLHSYDGLLGISFNVCTTTPTNPGACPAP